MKFLGALAISGGGDGTVRVWDTNAHDNLAILDGHDGEEVYCLELNDVVIVSGGADSTVCLWDRRTFALLHRLEGHVGVVRCMQVSDRAPCPQRVSETTSPGTHAAMQPACLPSRCRLQLDGWKLVTGGDKRKVIVWDWARGLEVNVVYRQPALVHRLWCDSQVIVTASPESSLSVVDYWSPKQKT